MAGRLTFDSLGSGGRWGQSGRLETPSAHIGIDWGDKDENGNYGLTAGEEAAKNRDKTNKWLAHKVHDHDYVGWKMNTPANNLITDVDNALSKYMESLRDTWCIVENDGCALDKMTKGEVQPLVRAVLDVKLKVRNLIDARADSASIEFPNPLPGGPSELIFKEGGFSDWFSKPPARDGKWLPRAASRATCCCMFFSLLLGLGAILIAAFFHTWGAAVYLDPRNITLEPILQASFWGWPEEKVFRNIWCGLMLGVVFGFLDNFGLFYGSGALDSTFYSIGSKIASGLVANTQIGEDIEKLVAEGKKIDYQPKADEVALAVHQVTEDMMSGLGNTFRRARRRAPAARPPRARRAPTEHPPRRAATCSASLSEPPHSRSPNPASGSSPPGGPPIWSRSY